MIPKSWKTTTDSVGKSEVFREATSTRRILAFSDYLCGITDVGRSRDHNEDTFHISEYGHVLIVADGMGGHESGEVASSIAVQRCGEFLKKISLREAEDGVSPKTLERAIQNAQEAVLDAKTANPDFGNMGTTLMLAQLSGNRLLTCHVGDVRCYIYSGNELRQITSDHSVVARLVRSGLLTADQARSHPQRNEILQAIGMVDGIEPEFHEVELQEGDLVLLCSDGLWDALEDEEIESVLAWEGSIRQLATQLVDRANVAGGKDNITAILYLHEHP